MKALVLREPCRLVYEDVPTPDVGADELLIEVEACTICGSDIHGIDGSTGRRIPPIVMGHEASGTVARVGERVDSWAVGDRVAINPTLSCGRCFFCERALPNLCERRQVLGVSCSEFRRSGAFAEYVAVPASSVYRLPEGLSFRSAALAEAASVALHAVRRSGLRLGESIAVVGAGMIGSLILQFALSAGASLLIAVDPDPSRRDLASRLGAHIVVDAGEDSIRAALTETPARRGVDRAVDAVGREPTFSEALGVLRPGGTLCLVGNLEPLVHFPLQEAVDHEITVRGSYAAGADFSDALELIARGMVSVDPLISVVAPLANGASWFDRLRRGEGPLMKVILAPRATKEEWL